jgi:hypothetical protein
VSVRSSAFLSPAGAPANAIDVVAAESTASFGKLATISKRFARRLLTIGENRPELLRVEVQEESERLQQACLCVVGTCNNWHPKQSQGHASFGERSLAEGNGLAAWQLGMLFGGGRPLDTGSTGQRSRAQPIWREKLASEGGLFPGNSPSYRRKTCP